MAKDFFQAVIDRRTFYGISKESVVSDDRIREIVEEATKYTPTSFNAQSGRTVLLLGAQHDKLWDIAMEALRKIVPPDSFAQTEAKINSFKNGYGTVLFFEDQTVIEGLQKQFELYKDNFPIWSQQSTGINQYIVWTALEIEGFGASLQHYTELIEDEVKSQWHIPNSWKLTGQMPFGKPTANPDPKDFRPIEERVKVFK